MRRSQAILNHRTLEQVREHYEIEKKLANRLRQASKQERRHLYACLYDELYRCVPLHPQLTRKKSPAETAQAVESQMVFLKRFLARDSTFVEIGAGDCALSREVARHVNRVYAVDVSDEITRAPTTPANFQLILSDGCSIPVPRGSAHVVYSNQLMEHLHPDDAVEQLQNLYHALAPGGIYICITPSRLTGPHDVSKSFDAVATGFHLKEYTISELNGLFKKAGFSNVRAYIGARGLYTRFPVLALVLIEWLTSRLPHAVRKAIVRSPFRVFLDVPLVGIK